MLREGDREELLRWTRSRKVQAGLVMRARIVLAAAAGEANEHIAQQESTTRTTVIKWRARYQDKGLDGLLDEPRSGRPRHVDHRDVVAATLYSGYSRMSQAVSELSATGAPTRPFLSAVGPVFTLLQIGLGVGMWRSARGTRPIR